MRMDKQPEGMLSRRADKDFEKLAGNHNTGSQKGTHEGLKEADVIKGVTGQREGGMSEDAKNRGG